MSIMSVGMTDAVHVWVGTPADFGSPRLVEQLTGWLSPDERQRHQRFHAATDRDAFLVAHGVLRFLIGEYLGQPPAVLRFEAGPHGRPELVQLEPGPRLRFNLSHTRGLVAWAFSLDRACGVDVEEIRDDVAIDRLAPAVCTTAECARLRALDPQGRIRYFYSIWSLKEALVKGCGLGIDAAADVTIEPAGSTGEYHSDGVPGHGAQAARWSLRGTVWRARHVLAVACEHRTPPKPRMVLRSFHPRALLTELKGRLTLA